MMKNKYICLIVALLFPVMALGQETVDTALNDYVEQLNARCPIMLNDDWAFNSYTLVGSYALVDIQTPATLSMILSSFTGKSDNVKQVWIRQFSKYDEPWNTFTKRMVAAGRSVVINLRPLESETTALITLSPSDFEKK